MRCPTCRPWPAPDTRRTPLPAQTQTLDQAVIACLLLTFQIVQEAPTLPDHDEQAATGVKILLVGFQVLSQVGDPFGQDRNLDFR